MLCMALNKHFIEQMTAFSILWDLPKEAEYPSIVHTKLPELIAGAWNDFPDLMTTVNNSNNSVYAKQFT